MGNFGSLIFQGTNPAEQYQDFQAKDAALASNSLEDAIRQNQIAAGKETTKQEAIKSQELNRSWEWKNAYSKALAKNTKLEPADGYYKPGTAGGPSSASPAMAGMAGTSNSLAGTTGAANASADSGLGGMAGMPVPSKPMDPNNPATYKVTTDHDAIGREMTAAGWGPEVLKQDEERNKAAKEGIETYTKQYDLQVKKQKALADALAGVPETDFNEPDPDRLKQQQLASETGAMQQLHLAVQQRVIDPSMEKTLEQWISGGPWNPEKQQLIKQLANSATSSAGQHQDARAGAEQHLKMMTGEAQATEREQTALSKGLSNAAQTAGGITDQTTLDAWYNNLKPDMQKQFKSLYNRGFSPQTINAIKSMGQTEENRLRDQETAAQHDATNAQRAASQDSSEELRRMSIEVRRDALNFRKDQKKDTETADQKKAMSEIYDYEKQEQPYYTKIGELQTAIGKGATGYYHNGKLIPMDVSDMKDELDQARSDAKGLISKKYALIDKFGGKPKISQQEMEDKIDGVGKGPKPAEPAEPVETAVPAKKAATAKPSTGPKQAVTMDHVRNYAKQKGIPEAQAVKEFKDYGYPIQQ